MARGDGLRVRFSRISGETPRSVLARGPLWLPAVLGDFSSAEDALDYRDYLTIGGGEFSQRAGGDEKARKLRTTDTDTLTVKWDAPWLVEHNGVPPHIVREELDKIMRSRRAVEMLITQRLDQVTELRMNVTLRTMSRSLRHGTPGIRWYSISYKEWRNSDITPRTSDQSRAKVKLPTKHELDSDDTLHSLAKHYYGSAVAWRTIAQANGITGWGPDTALVKAHRFKVGDSIKIPKKPPMVSTPEGHAGIPGTPGAAGVLG